VKSLGFQIATALSGHLSVGPVFLLPHSGKTIQNNFDGFVKSKLIALRATISTNNLRASMFIYKQMPDASGKKKTVWTLMPLRSLKSLV